MPALILTVLCLLAAASAQQPGTRGIAVVPRHADEPQQKFAVIIGIDQYEDEAIADLKFAVKDARAIHEVLASAPGGFDKSRSVLLADGEDSARLPTRGKIIRYMKTYIDLVGPQDTLLVYFAGHGASRDGKLHLLPSDATLADVEETGIPFAYLENMLKNSPAQQKILLLDACHSGTGRDTSTLSTDAYDQMKKAVERESKGMLVLASCGPEQLSHEMPETGHGAFTHFLIEGLNGNADTNQDGLLSASEVSLYTWKSTRLWAAGRGISQTPWRMEQVAGEIILMKVGNTTIQVQTVPQPQPVRVQQEPEHPKPNLDVLHEYATEPKEKDTQTIKVRKGNSWQDTNLDNF